MWAMIPMFRVRARGTSRVGIAFFFARRGAVHGSGALAGARLTAGSSGELPAVVGEGLVGLGHLVDVFLALDGGADGVARVQQLVGETLGHGLLTTLAAVADDPADGEGRGLTGTDLDR